MPLVNLHPAAPRPIEMAEIATSQQTSSAGCICPVTPGVEDLVYANSAARSVEGDFGAFSKCKFVAVTLESSEPVDGDASYRVLESRLESSDRFGKEYRSRVTIVGPRRV